MLLLFTSKEPREEEVEEVGCRCVKKERKERRKKYFQEE